MQKANIPNKTIEALKNAFGREKEIYGLNIALNTMHHGGNAIIDYVGILSAEELDKLSNISEQKIKEYKKKIS